VEVPPRTKTTTARKRTLITLFSPGTKLPILAVLPREQKSNQGHFLAMIASELSNENMNAKRRVPKNQLVMHMDKSMYCTDRKIRRYFAKKTMIRVPHPVYSPDLSPCDFGSSAMQRNE
jgi:hypothetical protein